MRQLWATRSKFDYDGDLKVGFVPAARLIVLLKQLGEYSVKRNIGKVNLQEVLNETFQNAADEIDYSSQTHLKTADPQLRHLSMMVIVGIR
jgi:hypothetical protein